MNPEKIISNTSLKCSIRYAAGRVMIEKNTTCRKKKRELKFFLIKSLNGKKVKGSVLHGKKLRDFVIFPDKSKAVF